MTREEGAMDKPQDFPRLDALQSDAPEIALRAVSIGTVASLCVFGALGLLGRREARSAVAPINATSHVLYGADAGEVDDIDISHTGVGSVINHGASIFWALPFTWWLSQTRNRSASGSRWQPRQPPRSPGRSITASYRAAFRRDGST